MNWPSEQLITRAHRKDTVNRSRLRFKHLRDYIRVIVDTVREPLIVLSEDLRVKMANRSFYLNQSLRSRSMTDELTGLRNRQGFSVLSRRFMALAHGQGKGIFVVFADLDGLKRIPARSVRLRN